jgi:pimeloyl-ACP methyl ester carboxylesterase
MRTHPRPVVFIHGLWLHADSWENWIVLFREHGYDSIAPSWPGVAPTVDEARRRAREAGGVGIEDVVRHYAGLMRVLPEMPIVIGHSFGGLVAQILLGRSLAAAAVAIDAAPVHGVFVLPWSALRIVSKALLNPLHWSLPVALTEREFRYGFGNAVSAEESAYLYDRFAIPSTGRPLFQAAFASLNPWAESTVETGNPTRGPLLLVAGERDRTVPPAITRATFARYNRSPALTDLIEMRGRGHSLTIDSGWREVAATTLGWLHENFRS